jgi:hypothetical protein
VWNPFTPTYLNAGPAITLNAPSAKITLPLNNGVYASTGTTPFVSPTGGTYAFDNGSGGTDVGPFSVSQTLAAPLTWSDASAITTVSRSQGVKINWTGGDANSYVQITGFSTTGTSASDVGGYFVCTAAVSPQTFTIPASVLLALPPSGTVASGGVTVPLYGSLVVGNYSNPKQFTATGLDYGFLTGFSSNSISVIYQ